MKLICDAWNWDYNQTLGYPVGGSCADIKTEESTEAAAHLQLAAERDLFCKN